MRFNLPNLLTLFRIALIPLFILVFYLDVAWAAPGSALIFALGGITDWVDGWLARTLGQTSRFGAFLDPVADKLMVAAALIMLAGEDGSVWLTVPAVVIVGREIAVSALREWMAEVGQRKRVAVSQLGKLKTTAQIAALLLLLYREPLLTLPVYAIGMVLLYVAAVLTLWSMLAYMRAALREA